MTTTATEKIPSSPAPIIPVKLVKLRVGKSVLSPMPGSQQVRNFYELEFDTSALELEKAREWAVQLISSWLPTPGSSASADAKQEVKQEIDFGAHVKQQFAKEFQDVLSFSEVRDFIIIKPKTFLGAENFAKIAAAVRGLGGEYVSQGRDSYFRVPKKT